MRSMSSVIPWFWPGLVVSLVIALVVARPVARAFGAARWQAIFLFVSLGAIVSATLTPDSSGLSTAPWPSCDLSRLGFDTLRAYVTPSETSLNVLLFVPLGFALAILPASRHRSVALVASFGVTFAVEGLQLLVFPLGRGCQSADLVDNTIGLAIGLLAGAVIALAAGRATSPSIAEDTPSEP